MFERPQQVLYTVKVNLPAAGSYQYRMISFVGDKYVLSEILDETPSGTIDGTNVTFTLANLPVAGSVKIVVDGSTTVTDDGEGNLSDGGTIDYSSGSFILNAAPATSVVADYLAHEPDGVIVDDTSVSSAGLAELKVMFAGVMYEDLLVREIREVDKAILRRRGIFVEPRLSVNY